MLRRRPPSPRALPPPPSQALSLPSSQPSPASPEGGVSACISPASANPLGHAIMTQLSPTAAPLTLITRGTERSDGNPLAGCPAEKFAGEEIRTLKHVISGHDCRVARFYTRASCPTRLGFETQMNCAAISLSTELSLGAPHPGPMKPSRTLSWVAL